MTCRTLRVLLGGGVTYRVVVEGGRGSQASCEGGVVTEVKWRGCIALSSVAKSR